MTAYRVKSATGTVYYSHLVWETERRICLEWNNGVKRDTATFEKATSQSLDKKYRYYRCK